MADQAKGRWAWAAGIAVAIFSGIVLFLSLAKPPTEPLGTAGGHTPSGPRPAIGLSGSLKDEAALLDPAALFLPTKWSAGQKDVPWPEPGGAFQNYRIEPKLSFSDAEPNVPLPPSVVPPATPAAALMVNASAGLALGFGRIEARVDSLRPRGAYVEIVSTRTGRSAISARVAKEVERLAAESRPPVDRPWQPFDFLAAVDAAGLVGPLVIVEPRSGVEEVDRYFQDFLVRTVRVGERLPAGFYRISVGP